MARTVLAIWLVGLLIVLTGCYDIDSGASQLVPAAAKITAQEDLRIGVGEADIVEQMVIDRQAYRTGLESLIAHYKATGNDMKLRWAEDELKSLEQVPQYNYIVDAAIAGPELKATASIREADLMFADAVRLEREAKRLIVIYDEDLLRTVLAKYNEIINRHPSSDKIDDAAFRAGGILEYFKDYTLAVLYYKRAYQWDPQTENPAMFKAASVLDKYLLRRAEALELYEKAVERESLGENYKQIARRRIEAITKSKEKIE